MNFFHHNKIYSMLSKKN